MLWLYISTLLAVAQAGLFSQSNVLKLTGVNFQDQVLNNDNVTVVEFYSPSSKDCKASAPELKKSAKSLHGIVNVGAVNCDAAENKKLCSHYKIKALPSIKVFQPQKKTDKDFKAVNQGEKIELKPHNILSYTGPHESRAINKYAVSKIRNYAATLDGDMGFVWLKSTRVPRVIMLPGSRYKSKSIAPLFKVLSNEFFGKLRFAYLPRRGDGGWNLIGLQAPEESTLVYLSDDKTPYVYKGDLTKSKVTAFLNEQHGLEMARRRANDISESANPEDAAFGLEYVLEDQQDDPLETVERLEKDYEENWSAYNYYINSARERKYRRLASEKGDEYTAIESTVANMPYTRPFTLAAAPSADPDLESFDPFTAKIAQPTGASDDDVGTFGDDEIEEAEIDDPEAGSIFEIEDWTDAMLDEIDIDLAPNEVVAEGKEAIESWRAELEKKAEVVKADREKKVKRYEEINQIRAQQAQKKVDAKAAKGEKRRAEEQPAPSPVQQLPPGITPKPIKHEKAATNNELSEEDYLEDHALSNVDELLQNCIRREKVCVLISSSKGFIKEDIRVMLNSRARFDGKTLERLVFQFYEESSDPELEKASEELGISPYHGTRTNGEGVTAHAPGIAIFDYKKGKYAVFEPEHGDFTAEDITQFIARFMLEKKQVVKQKLPLKFIYYVTEDDVEIIEQVGFDAEDSGTGHDEL